MYKLALWLALLAVTEALSQGVLNTTDVNISQINESVLYNTAPNETEAQIYTPESTLPPTAECITTSGENGFCVQAYLCDMDVERFNKSCPSPEKPCCLRLEDDEYSDSYEDAPRQMCGWSQPNGIGVEGASTIGGQQDTKFGEFPWMVVITRKELISEDLTVDAYVGAGSLIHLKVALTAAHVVAGKQNLTVRAGEWNLKSTDEEFGHSSRNVSSTVVHEKYDKEKMLHDVALLFLKQSMFAVPNVGVACLPPSDQLVPEDWKCIASGWGKFKKGETQHILKKFKMLMVKHQECQKMLRTKLGYFFDLNSSNLCAKGEVGVNIAAGNGGSPLICPIKDQRDRYMQTGVVAWSIDGDLPIVLTSVAAYRAWIDAQVTANGLDPTDYSF